MAILILLCETDNLIMEDTGNFQEPLDRFLNYEQARGEVGQYYTELQKFLGQQAVVDGEIDFPPEFVRFETVRASSVEYTSNCNGDFRLALGGKRRILV